MGNSFLGGGQINHSGAVKIDRTYPKQKPALSISILKTKTTLKSEVAIIGAGIAGLRCAQVLLEKGIEAPVFEADLQPGGRMATIEKDGFLLDVGFQVLLDSYEEIKGAVDLQSLVLYAFPSGALVAFGHKAEGVFNPLSHPDQLFKTAFSTVFTFRDKFKMLGLVGKASRVSSDFFKLEDNLSTLDFLQQSGFSEFSITRFFKPFFGGVFLDSELGIPHVYFLWLLKQFFKGRACLPKNGMAAIPLEMAKRLNPGQVRYGKMVIGMEGNRVRFQDGDSFEAKKWILATGLEAIPERRQPVPEFLPTKAPPPCIGPDLPRPIYPNL